jgi:RsiW-degrading membrane proteinase PrsW (M82 family)
MKCESSDVSSGNKLTQPAFRLLYTVIPPIGLLGYLYSPLFGRRDGLKIVWLALMVSLLSVMNERVGRR